MTYTPTHKQLPVPQMDIPEGSMLAKALRAFGMELIEDETPTEKFASHTPYYDEYHNDPVGFGERVLKHSYPEEVKAMMRSVSDHVNTSARSANAVGKTYGAADTVIWFILTFHDAQVYTFAAPPESNLRDLLWGEINRVVAEQPQLFTEFSITTMRIMRNSKSFVRGVTIPVSGDAKLVEGRFSGKHAPHMLFVGDEADGIPEPVFKGVESCMSGGHCRLLMTFNPRQEAGTPYRMEKQKEANVVHLSAFHHPNVVTGDDIFPGAVTRETTCRRINMWTRSLLPGESQSTDCFQVPDFLVGYEAKSHGGQLYPPIPSGWRIVIVPQFSYMVLGLYPAIAEGQLISRAWIDAARARYDAYVAVHGDVQPAGTKAIMGQDVAEMGKDLNCSVFRYGGFVKLPIIWGEVDPIVTGDKAAGLYKSRGAWKCQVDGTGVGAGVAPYMRRKGCPNSHRIMFGSSPKEDDIPESYKEMGTFRYMRDLAWWACREWLRTDPGAMLPPDEMLLDELITPTYVVTQFRIAVMDADTMREKLGRSADRASALILTFCPDPDEAAVAMGESTYA